MSARSRLVRAFLILNTCGVQIVFRNVDVDAVGSLFRQAPNATELQVDACLQVTPFLGTGKKSVKLDSESIS